MSFTMSVVNEEEIKAIVQEEVKPIPEEVRKLKEVADKNVEAIMALDITKLDGRKEILKSIETFGMSTMTTSSKKNSLLQVSVGNLSKSGDEGGMVAKDLAALQFQLKDLDPSMIDFAKTGFLGKLFNPLRAYFQRYEKADEVIADIVKSLEKGKITLKDDNTTLELEQHSLRALTKTLQKEIQLGVLMDESIEAQVELAKRENEDPDKIRFIEDEVLFPLRQRLMDLQQMLTVNQQGILAFEIVIRNNRELIRGVDRANTVTISALRNAVTVARALYNQKIVLQKINALNATTNNLIEGVSRMLNEQGVEIQKHAIESNISVETLKVSFAETLKAFESINNYKREALPKMRETINQFKELANVGEQQIQRIEKGTALGLQ